MCTPFFRVSFLARHVLSSKLRGASDCELCLPTTTRYTHYHYHQVCAPLFALAWQRRVEHAVHTMKKEAKVLACVTQTYLTTMPPTLMGMCFDRLIDCPAPACPWSVAAPCAGGFDCGCDEHMHAHAFSQCLAFPRPVLGHLGARSLHAALQRYTSFFFSSSVAPKDYYYYVSATRRAVCVFYTMRAASSAGSCGVFLCFKSSMRAHVKLHGRCPSPNARRLNGNIAFDARFSQACCPHLVTF